MPKIIIVYDDSMKVCGRAKTILGEKSYGEMILKRESMFLRMKEIVKTIKGVDIVKLKKVDSFNLNNYSSDTIFFHLLASSAVLATEEFKLLIEKVKYAKNNYIVKDEGKIHGAIVHNKMEYVIFLDGYKETRRIDHSYGDCIDTNIFVDLSDYEKLLLFISGGFESRYFNSLQGDANTVTKHSSDKKKMKKEYSYYWLLPEPMKSWMVMPYNYEECETSASYTMERMPMTDIAIRWTHSAIDLDEFRKILDKSFYYFGCRNKKEITSREYCKTRDRLYLDKLNSRIIELKKMDEYSCLADLVKIGTDYPSIDEIVENYKKVYRKVLAKNKERKYLSVIGHGDFFFANMLYSKELNMLKLIDPKGALRESDLWTDPYYDIAKLSHSVCGNYDFFNTGSYSIDLNSRLKFELNVFTDNTKEKEIFKKYLDANGYDYYVVRIYEASLFLSMLPLHIDNLHKVLGFVLNAINIIEEVDENV